MKAYEYYQTPIIALEKIADERVSSYGIFESKFSEGKFHRMLRFLEKPKPAETASRLGVIGKYVITPEVFEYFEAQAKGASKDGEIRLADAFARMVDHAPIYGVEIEGERYDTGDKLGFIQATIAYALERDGLGDKVWEYMKARVEKGR